MTVFRRFRRRAAGVSSITYGLVLALVAIAVLASITALGDSINAMFYTTENAVTDVSEEPETPPAPAASLALTIASGSASGNDVVSGETPNTVSLSLTNNGTATSAVLTVSSDNAANFPVVPANESCSGETLAVGETCTIAITPQATANGPISGTISVGGQSVTLSGTASGF